MIQKCCADSPKIRPVPLPYELQNLAMLLLVVLRVTELLKVLRIRQEQYGDNHEIRRPVKSLFWHCYVGSEESQT